MEILMTAKKTAARKRPEAKPAKATTAARKTVSTKAAAKPAMKKAAKTAAVARKPAAKSAAPKAAPAKNPAPKASAKPAATKKTAAAAARAKPAASAKFDPDRRRELIAAAAARRRKTVTVKAPPAPIAIIQQREPSPVERHRFSVGDEVRVISTSGMWFKHGIDYRITAALPPQGGKLQYRIKNEQEPFERVVSESQLASPQASSSHAQV
jgi:hypothetical protein